MQLRNILFSFVRNCLVCLFTPKVTLVIISVIIFITHCMQEIEITHYIAYTIVTMQSSAADYNTNM